MSGEAAERVRAFIAETWAPWKLQGLGVDLTGDDLTGLLDERDALRGQAERVNQVRRWVVPNGYAGGPEGDKTTAVMVRLDDLRAALDGPA